MPPPPLRTLRRAQDAPPNTPNNDKRASSQFPLDASANESSDLLMEALFSPQNVQIGDMELSPIDNVRHVLELDSGYLLSQRYSSPAPQQQQQNGSSNGSGAPLLRHTSPPRPLFCEMLYLSTSESPMTPGSSHCSLLLNNNKSYESMGSTDTSLNERFNSSPALCWRQIARWIKYQQQVEGDGTRFSKPHITLLTVHSLLQLKNCLREGVVLLDLEASNVIEIFDKVIEAWHEGGFLPVADDEQLNLAKDVLYAPKLHLIRGKMRKINEVTCDEHFNTTRRGSLPSVFESFRRAAFVEDCGESDDDSNDNRNADERLLKRLPSDTDAAVILVSNVDGLNKSLSVFVRLNQRTLLYPEMPDHPVPVRFLFILLCPPENYAKEASGIGRAMGALLSDEIFERVAYTATTKSTLADAVEEFFSQIVAIPPGKCNTEARWDPHDLEITTRRSVGTVYSDYAGLSLYADTSADADDDDEGSKRRAADDVERNQHARLMLKKRKRRRRRVWFRKASPSAESELGQSVIYRTGRCFGGLILDICRKKRCYHSDFVDFFETRLSQCLAATMTIFFANLAQIITFAGVMERALQQQMAAIENIVSGGLCGVIFGLFAGQPLNILSVTGPTLVFEKILYDFCTAYNWEYLPFRFYVGVWIAVLMLILVATDASVLVGLITRFTEEAFMALIALVFIIQSFEKLYEISYEASTAAKQPDDALRSTCRCLIETIVASNGTAPPVVLKKNLSIGIRRCREFGGIPQGYRCYFKPDIYLLSVLLAFGTFSIALAVSKLRHSHYFTHKIRSALADFCFLIAIVLMTILTHFIGVDIPSIKIPSSLRPTLERSWLVDVTDIAGIEAILFAFLPAFFYTILLVMDQQITAVIVNRPNNKLKKGGGYHLDLFVIMLLILMCSLFGLPFYIAATLLSTTHLNALKLYSYSFSAPGVLPKFLGIMEQRMSAILSHLLIGSSIFVTPLLKLIPLPVLTGIFLYMGVVSLLEQQFLRRITLIFMSDKNLPDYKWLRAVRMNRVHLFTAIQILSFVVLLAIKYASTFSMVFPIMLVVMVLIRMHVLQRIFTETELRALDDQLAGFREVWQPFDASVSHQPAQSSKSTNKTIQNL